MSAWNPTMEPIARMVELDDLQPHPRNYKRHPAAQIERLQQSLIAFGQPRPISVWRGTILAGHGVYAAARESGWQDIWCALAPDEWTEERATAWMVADNETARGSEVDETLLAELIEQSRAAEIDPATLGFADDDLAALLAGLEAPEVEPGDGGGIEDIELDDAGDVPDLLAPFPWFGGKSRVASRIWQRFGVVDNYVEPFCGSAAVLLAAPEPPPIVTLNDADGFIANFWRAVAADPDAVAAHLDWPVNEIDLFARHVWLVKRYGELRQRLEADPNDYDARLAGWWCWGVCAWIGTGWCSGEGPWSIGEGGELVNIRASNAGQGVNRKLPHLGNAGRGVNRQLPHLGNAGQGVNRQLPDLGNGHAKGALAGLQSVGTCTAITDHLHDYMARLADALRTARVTCGDWSRVVTDSVTIRHGVTALLLDPPYGEGEQEYSAGGNGDGQIAADVWDWAVANGNDPLLRIAVCGYEDGRAIPPGWSALRWTARKGYQVTEDAVQNPRREVVWFSPACVGAEC